MSKSRNFTGWAVDRAEAIVSNQGFDLLNSRAPDSTKSVDQCIVRLTVAILEALIEARNFESSNVQTSTIN